MCRLYGFLSNEPTKVECTLVYAQNALLHQSRGDLRGESHPDGWGISCYRDGLPRRERRAVAAHEDLSFSAAAERIYSRVVVAHVRQATVGTPQVENAHPFTHGPWTFAHNGTLTGFEHLGPRLAEETDATLRRLRAGTTDSEAVFYWLLTRMASSGIAPEAPCRDLPLLTRILADSVRRLAGWSDDAGAAKPARLNLLLTDGNVLVVSRWRNSLHWVERTGVHDCEICGIPHVHHDRGTPYRAALVASEPISGEAWQEAPDPSILTVGSDVRLRVQPL